MKKILLLLLLSGVWSALHAAIPSPVRDTTGIVCSEFVYDRAEFPSCHAATIVETARGELMIALFGGKYESNADCSIWASHLRADGWESPRLVADGLIDSVKTACWNPVLFQVPGGELLLFYKVGRYVQDWSGWLIRSQDGGYTWSAPERLPDGFLGPIKNKPLLWGDRLLCGTSLERGGWRTYLEVTDPAVTTWRSIGPLNNRLSRTQIIQPSLLAHPDGGLQAICRAIDLRGNIISLFSRDGGETWSEPCSTGLPNNDSGLDAVALSDGRFLLVYNHIEAVKSGAAARSPINVALSDNGRDWYAALTLEDSPGDEYSYPSVIQSSDGLVHIVYTWHRSCIKHVVLDPARLSIDPRRRIVDEHWVEPLPADSRRWEAHADSLLAQMTLEERLDCLAGHWRPHDRGTHDLLVGGVARLGIPDFRMEFALEGVHTNGKSTLYPAPLALAATFDSTLVAAVGRSIAADCRARAVQAALAPELTLFDGGDASLRATTFGDRPLHASRCALAFAEGLAAGGIMPVGRYCAPSAAPEEGVEAARREMLRRTLASGRFGGLLLRGGSTECRAVEDSLFNRGFLRGECRFDGVLLGDLWQTRSTRGALRGGLDIDLPRGQWLDAERLQPLIDSGELSPEEVDRRVRRMLVVRQRFALMNPAQADPTIPANRPASRRVALDAACRSLVLLRNEDALLPLSASRGGVLVLGNRLHANTETGGDASVYPYDRTTLADALAGREGFELLPEAREYIDLTLTGEFFADEEATLPGIRARYFAGGRPAVKPAVERIERYVDYAWGPDVPVESCDSTGFTALWNTFYRPAGERVVRFGLSGHGRWTLLLDGREVLRSDDDPAAPEHIFMLRAEAGRTYRLELRYDSAGDASDIQLTCTPTPVGDLDARMRRASKLLFCVGNDGDLDAESRFWLEQAACYPRKSIVVLQSCDVNDLAWSLRVASAVVAWHGGQEAGRAIAGLLTGEFAPTGRMPLATLQYPFGFGLGYDAKQMKRVGGR